MSLLEVRDLRVSYGGIEALKGVSFDVEEGQIITYTNEGNDYMRKVEAN